MTMDTIIGVDLAKNVFQLHGASDSGEVKFRKKLTREQFRRFMADHPPAMVVMEACGSAHYRAREMEKLGHAVKLIAPRYVKPFVKLCAAEHNFTYHQEDIMRRKVSRTPVSRSFQRKFLRIISGASRLS
jgi:transposase